MKKNVIRFLFLSVIIFTVSFSASAQVYVKIRPAAPVVVRSAQPDKSQVWINEEWEPNGGTYRYTGGHWATPSHPGYRWKQGHWRRHHKDGEEWVAGSWVK
jgi:WXXGXW repeat (2 copies)